MAPNLQLPNQPFVSKTLPSIPAAEIKEDSPLFTMSALIAMPGHSVAPVSRISAVADQGAVRADFTIDATGSRQWLANELQLSIETASPPLIAHYGYVEGDYAEARDAPILISTATGWTWIARVRDRTYQWTRLDLCSTSETDCRRPTEDCPCELRSLTPVGHTHGADVTWRCAAAPAGPGYFLCGDAAAVLDPASSHGVLKAVMSGIYAGHLIEQTRSKIKDEANAATEYANWLQRWFRHDVEALREHYLKMGLTNFSRAGNCVPDS